MDSDQEMAAEVANDVSMCGQGPRSPSALPVEQHWPTLSDSESDSDLPLPPSLDFPLSAGPPPVSPGSRTIPVCKWCSLDHQTMDCPTPVCLTCSGPHWASKCTNGECTRCGPQSHDTAFCPRKCSRCLGADHQAWSCQRPWKCLKCGKDGHVKADCPNQASPYYCYGCRKWGNHSSWQCPEPPQCWKCGASGNRGHWQSQCPMKDVKQRPPVPESPLASVSTYASGGNGFSLLAFAGSLLGGRPRPAG